MGLGMLYNEKMAFQQKKPAGAAKSGPDIPELTSHMRARMAGAIASALCGLAIALGLTAAEGADKLKDIRDRYNLNIDNTQISVSGISSGGWIANQFHIAHSEIVMGAGILAAGPYHCAGTNSLNCSAQLFMPHDTCQAFYVCSSLARASLGQFGWAGGYFGPPDVNQSIDSTIFEAAHGTIAPLENLKGDRVWLFSGTMDRLEPTEVVERLRQYYLALFRRPEVGNPETNIHFQINADGRAVDHAMIIDAPNAPDNCLAFGLPFIDDCSYDAAGELLKFIYAPYTPSLIQPQHGVWDRTALLEFDQTDFFAADDPSISMNRLAHVFVPQTCQSGTPCRLHIAFHGCEQYQQIIENDCEKNATCSALFFFRNAGYNEWADANNIVVLYPQAINWGDKSEGLKNPYGCWDWWGYSGSNYFQRTGKQITAVKKMVDCLAGSGSCP